MENVRDIFPKYKNKHNFVAEDGRRKELILMEEKARRNWGKNWYFLKGENIEKLHEAQAIKLGLESDFMKNRYRGEKQKQETIYLQNLKRKPFPKLTSGMIGWRSSDPDCWIDKPGPMYVSDKTYAFIDPEQSLNENWKCIYLG